MYARLFWFFLCVSCSLVPLSAQRGYWQQALSYQMDVEFEVERHRYEGRQVLHYVNHSPDTLRRLFYHLYFNAFQPGSMMDQRSRSIVDPDPRVGERISQLSQSEIGYLKVDGLTQDGRPVRFEEVGTILEVELNQPIFPGDTIRMEMAFRAQVPVQIRRSGRDNNEGVAYSMAQWYPKLCEYDYKGWHANPYVGREFYGNWGDFDVKISIDADYVLGGTGYVQNGNEVGHGYEEEGVKVKRKGRKNTWHFKADRVHDFMWAADPDYVHRKLKRKTGTVMHFLYQPEQSNAEAWERLPDVMDRAFDIINERFGAYPYRQYSFIQGGDGGMEYPMSTLITGKRNFLSLVGVSVHELMHSWYQGVLGNNESLYPWMDEGFTSFATAEVMNQLAREGLLPGYKVRENPHRGSLEGLARIALTDTEEPMSTHADHYTTNTAYSVAAYVKGAVYLTQLRGVVGHSTFNRALLRYYNQWKFRHPTPNDFIRVVEKESGLELDWYNEYMINSTHTIDYAVEELTETSDGSTLVELEKVGTMPMPLDVQVRYSDGTEEWYHIPLRIMRGHKPLQENNRRFTLLEDWPWTQARYSLILERPLDEVEEVIIDPSFHMADVHRDNNTSLREEIIRYKD
jgi:hypothetical protein